VAWLFSRRLRFYLNLKDRQRGLMKSRIKRHLHERHNLSERTIGIILKEAFASD